MNGYVDAMWEIRKRKKKRYWSGIIHDTWFNAENRVRGVNGINGSV